MPARHPVVSSELLKDVEDEVDLCRIIPDVNEDEIEESLNILISDYDSYSEQEDIGNMGVARKTARESLEINPKKTKRMSDKSHPLDEAKGD